MKKRKNNLSYMRAIACLAIVLFHTFQAAAASLGGVARTAADAAAGTADPTAAGLVASFVTGRNLMLWAVPCFVMVTGALMLDPAREVSLGRLFRRYIWRVVRALLIFTAVYEAFDILFGLIAPANPLADWALRLVTGTSWSPLWYLYMMIGIYLLLPAFRGAAGAMSRQGLAYTVVILTIFQSLLPVLTTLGMGTAFYIPVYTVYPLYLFAGYLLATSGTRSGTPNSFAAKDVTGMQPGMEDGDEKAAVTATPTPGSRAKALAVFGLAISAAIIVCATLYGYFADSELVRRLISDYSSLPVAVLSLSVFALFAARKEAEEGHLSGFSVLLLSVDRASFGIYLVHIILVNLVFEVSGFSPEPFGIVGGFLVTLLLAVIIFMVSFLLVAGFQKAVEGIRGTKVSAS